MKRIILCFYLLGLFLVGHTQVPIISYSNPQAYVLGTAITALLPSNTGGAVPATIPGTVSTLAGSGTYEITNGTGAAASFKNPQDVAVDGSGNVYVADMIGMIRKITAAGVVTTVAGSDATGYKDATGTSALFKWPVSLDLDAAGNLFVADAGNCMIRKITPAKVVTTLAGSIAPGSYDGTGTAARFNYPNGVTIDASGNIYVSDQHNNMIRKITADGVVTTLAGSIISGATNGTGTAAKFTSPGGIAQDISGNILVGDGNTGDGAGIQIRKISPDGVVTTHAVVSIYGIAIDRFDNLYVTDIQNNLIRKITAAGVSTILAGNSTPGNVNGVGTVASFNRPRGLDVDASGNVYVADDMNHMIRKIIQTGYSISPSTLPEGLSFDATTGKISGTPTTTWRASNYTITGTNASGSSSATITIEVVPPAPTVSTLAADGILSSEATLNGTINSNDEYTYTTVTFDYGLTTSYGTTVTATQSPVTGTTATPVSYVLSGLVPNTTYHFRVNGVNNGGTTNGSDLTFTTSAAAPTVTTNAAGSITTTGATLNGSVNSKNASTAVTFEYGLTTSYGTTVTATQSPVAGTTATAVTYVVSGLVPNTTYHFRVNGVNLGGTINGTDLTFTTSATAPSVTTAEASSITTTGATLNGTVNANNASTAVTFEYGLTTSYGTSITATQSPVTGSTSTAVSSTISGLNSNTLYHYRVKGVNSAGTTNGGDATFTTLATVPGAPIIGTATAGNTQASVSFAAPASTGGSSITSYTVTSNPGGFTGTGTTSPIAVTGLTNGTAYTFTVMATNSVGTGDASSASNSVTPATVPGAPAIGTATAGNGQASVSFTAPASNGGSAITGYTVTSSQGGLTGTGSSSPIAVTGLTNGTAYTFTVTATNGAGTSVASEASNSVTPATVPSTPAIGTATAGNGQASVSFTAPASNGGSAITGYTVTSNPGGLTGTGSSSPIAVTGLTNGTAYTFTVTATNAKGTGAASSASNSVTPATVPGAPTIGTATAGDGQASVSFAAPSSTGGSAITGYTVTSSPGSFTATGTTSPIAVTGLTNGTAYTFTVTATNSVGTGAASSASNSVTPATVPGAPIIGTATVGNTQASVSFAAPVSNGGSSITSYTITSNPGGFTGTGTSSPIAVAGLTNGTAYTFTVTATNAKGTSVTSAASNSVTPKGNQTITFGNPSALPFGTTPTLSATASSGLTVTFTTSTPDVCSVTSNGVLTFKNVGTCTILADQAGNAVYSAAPTVQRSFTVNPVLPGVPTIGTATAGNTQASVSFTAPVSNGGSVITSYTVTSNPGGFTGTGTTSPIDVTGLTNGTAYIFTVTATNGVGTSAASAASNSVTPATVPDAPTIGTATAGDGQASVSFTAPVLNGGSDITGYTVTSNPGGFTGTGTYSPIVVTGLTNGTAYTFTVTATNGAGTSVASEASNSVTPLLRPTITGISPTSGPTTGGTSVVITGTKLSDATSVKFGSTTATITANTATSITATSPVGSIGAVDVTVTTAGGTSTTNASDRFTYVTPPSFTSTPVTTVDYNQAYNYNVTATTEGGLATTITAPTLPAWLTRSTGSGQSKASLFGNIPTGVQITGVAEDNDGNIYAITYYEINSTLNTIYKITPDGTTTIWKSGLISGSVFELHIANGYIYIPRSDNVNSITRVPIADPNATEELFVSLRYGAVALTEKNGWIYASDYDAREIVRINETTKDTETILTSADGIPISGAFGLDFDQNGNLFIATYWNRSILKYNTSTSTLSTVLSGLPTFATSVKVDKQGNFYVALWGSGLRKYKPDFSSYEFVSLNTDDDVWGLSMSETGAITYSKLHANLVYRIEPGVTLHGTPAKSDVGAHNVVLRATNSAGYTDQTFSINVVDNVAPVVSSYSPVTNATNVALQPTLGITFDEEVSLGTTGVLSIYNGATLVKSYDLSVAADKALFSLSSDKKTVSITLTENLPVNAVLSVGLGAGFVKDKYDNSFAGFTAASNTWQFTTINKVAQTITYPGIDAKTYGDADFTLGNAATDQGLTVTYTAADPTVVSITSNQATILKAGITKITATQTGDNTTFAATPVEQTLDVKKAALKITADNKSKTYDGQVFSNFTVTSTGFVKDETATALTGTLSFNGTAVAAVTAGLDYVVTPSGYSSDNYTITYENGKLDISKRPITITADANSKTYGDADPSLTAQVTSGTIITGDNASGSLTRATGEIAADYAISQGTYSYGSNYTETFVPANLTIGKRTITLTADAKSKTYGDADPNLTAQVTSGTIITGDNASGSLTRATGETASDYAISQGTYSYGSNYSETFVPANLTISKRAITLTADTKSKTYGDADPSLTAQVTSGTIITGDNASGSLTRATGETAADYAISQGTYTYGSNYTETFVPANLTIGKRAITLTADAKSKTYGDTDPSLTAQVTSGTIVTGDNASGSLTRATGETAADYAISQGTYTYGFNYSETFVPANLTIGKRAITLTADAKSKTYGDADPSLTAQVTSGTIVTGDNASGSLTRATGENATDYAISQGTYSYGSNYTETFVPANLTIAKRPLSVTAKIDSKTYDGTIKSSQTPIVGALVTGDVVNIVPIQLFDNANVGSNHVLTPSGLTLKNGTNNVTDNYLITYNTLSTGVITAKQLTISNPTVTTNKTVDGNTSASITKVGTLTGVETTDANNVTVAAVANYNNAAVGTGKTITVVYTLNGSAKGNYIAPANYVITNGKISDVVTLSPLLTPSPGCEGSGLNLDYSILTGTPTQYKITFDAAANSAGIQNVAYTDMPSSSTSGTLMINVPKKTVDGTYHGTLVMRDELGVESPAYSFTFTINLSADYILTKFNQIIFVDNSSKRFTAYQWYKDGVIINGATKQSYNDPTGLSGAYTVQVTDTKGNKIISCPKVLNNPKAVKVVAYPNPVKSSQTCTVQVSGLSGKDLENAELSVYTPQGVCIYQSSKVELLNSLKLPSVDGVYIGQLKTADGDKHLFKVVVIK